MRTILCYGDSNTYGSVPGNPGIRYGQDDRWPGVLRKALSPDWMVIEEGLPGRTTCSDDPIEGAHLNGRTYLRPCLESHRPIDVIALMLGTNDLKIRFNKTAPEIAMGTATLLREIREDAFRSNSEPPDVILIAPPLILRDLRGWDAMFEGGYSKSRLLAREIEQVAEVNQVNFLDASEIVECSTHDGFHIDDLAARALGAAVAEIVRANWG